MHNEKNERIQVITLALKMFREEAHLRKETEKVQTKSSGRPKEMGKQKI